MAEQGLKASRILVVEDEYLLADDLAGALEAAGAVVLGPLASIDQALALIEAQPHIDFALLDINLRGEMVFPVADALLARGVSFAFATGYDQAALPTRFAAVPRIEKPLDPAKLPLALTNIFDDAGSLPIE